MAITATAYGPYDAGAGANVTEDMWRKMARLWLPSLPVRGQANELRPFGDSTGMQMKIDTGAAWVRGAYGEWTSGVSIMPIAAAGGIPGGQSRIDRPIVRNDFVNNRMELDVLTGTPAASPSVPLLTQSSSVWEIALGEVGPIVNTTTTITAAMVTDKRVLVAEGGGAFLPSVFPSGLSTFTVQVPNIGYTNLRVWFRARDTTAGTGGTGGNIQFNGDTGAHYWWDGIKNGGGGAVTAEGGNATTLIPAFATAGGGLAADSYAEGVIEIPRFNDVHFMGVHARFTFRDGTGAWMFQRAGAWEPTTAAAITSITFTTGGGNFAIGSVFDFELY